MHISLQDSIIQSDEIAIGADSISLDFNLTSCRIINNVDLIEGFPKCRY